MTISEKFSSLYRNSPVAAYVKTATSLSRWTYLGLMVLGASLLILYIDNVKYINAELELLSQKEERLKELQSTNKMLYARYLELQNPERIDRLARETLGMVVPEEAPKRVVVRR